jgi:hypothetical protein
MHAAKFHAKLFHVAWPEMGVPRVPKQITAVGYGIFSLANSCINIALVLEYNFRSKL